MDTTQTLVLKKELQLMRETLMKDMKIMLEEQLLDKIKIVIKEKIADEKDSLLKIVEDIEKMKSDANKVVDFMSPKCELIMDESKRN